MSEGEVEEMRSRLEKAKEQGEGEERGDERMVNLVEVGRIGRRLRLVVWAGVCVNAQ